MIRLFSFFTLCYLVSSLNAQVMWQVGKSNSQKWFLMQTDEFNEAKLNPDVWQFTNTVKPYNINLNIYNKAENIQYKDGAVSLVVKKENYNSKVSLTDLETNYLKENNKSLNATNEYVFNYTGAQLISRAAYISGYFEMRFKCSDQKGIWPTLKLIDTSNETISLFEGKGEIPKVVYSSVTCLNGCDDANKKYTEKHWNGFTKLNESLAKDWNVISCEWNAEGIKYFINGNPVGFYKGTINKAKTLIVSNSVSKKDYGLLEAPDSTTTFPAAFDVDYIRIWGKADTSGKYKDNYTYFERSAVTVNDQKIYHADVAKKSKSILKCKDLKNEIGTITLLPILYNKYSLSIQGSNFGSVQVDVIDRFDKKVAGYAVSNMQYYVMDLSALPTGPYKVKVSVLNQVLEHDIPIINPEKVGEQRDGK